MERAIIIICYLIFCIAFIGWIASRGNSSRRTQSAPAQTPQRSYQPQSSPRTAASHSYQARPAQSVKTFSPPERQDFDCTFHFMLELMSIQDRHDDYPYPIEVTAKNGGDITLKVNGLVGSASYLKDKYPVVYQHYFGNRDPLGAKSLTFQFHEPNCYLYRCSRAGLEGDIAESTPDAHVESHYLMKNGDVYFTVLFHYKSSQHSSDESFEHYLERCKVFERTMDIWYRSR